MLKDYEEIIRDLKNKIYHTTYILEGDEPFYIDKICDYVEHHILSEAEKSFNLNIIYGRDTSDIGIATLAKGYPMFGNYQVIIVKEAQSIKNWDAVATYSEKPLKSTMLFLSFMNEKIDKRSNAVKTLVKNSVVLSTKSLFDNQVPAWIEQYVKKEGYKIETQAAAVLADYTGKELSRISNQLDKLMLNVKKEVPISIGDINKYIGIHKDYNVFELNKALGNRNILLSNRIAQYFSENEKQNPIVLTLGSLYSYFNKVLIYHSVSSQTDAEIASHLGVSTFFLGDYKIAARNYSQSKTIEIIHYLNDFDLKSKGIVPADNTNGGLIKELVYKILH